jgi:hypothetical protein
LVGKSLQHVIVLHCILKKSFKMCCEALAWKSKAVQQQTTVILKKPSHDVEMGRSSWTMTGRYSEYLYQSR